MMPQSPFYILVALMDNVMPPLNQSIQLREISANSRQTNLSRREYLGNIGGVVKCCMIQVFVD
jgi:hypothetical protein